MLLTGALRNAKIKSTKLRNAKLKEVIPLINTAKLKGRMAEMELTQKDIAREMNLATPTINQKINNLRSMSLEEAERLSKILKIESTKFGEYFFN